MGFELNAPSVGIGFGGGVLTTLAVQRALRAYRQFQANRAPSAEVRETAALRLSDGRYVNALIRLCQTQHLLGHAVPLTALLVAPLFIPAPQLVAPPEENVDRDVFENVPSLPDYPQFAAPFNMPTLDIAALGDGHKRIVIVGAHGSGRSTALHAIALWSMGMLRLEKPTDPVSVRLAQADAALSAQERTERIKRRVQSSQAVRQRFAQAQEGEEKREDKAQSKQPALRRLAPFYCHLANLRVSGEYGRTIDPAEPLVRAVQAHVGYVAARAVPRALYRVLGQGRALLLLDGWDEIDDTQREHAHEWLGALLTHYPQTMVIVTAGAQGSHPLTTLGFETVLLRGWHDAHRAELMDKLAQHSKRILGQAYTWDETQEKQLPVRLRHLNPYETTLRLLAHWAEIGDRPHDILNFYLSYKTLKNEALLETLGRLAPLQARQGSFNLAALQEVIAQEHRQEADEDEKAAEKRLQQLQRKQARLLRELKKRGLIVAYRGRIFRLRDETLAAHLLAPLPLRTLLKLEFASPQLKRLTMRHASQHHDTSTWVAELLESTPTLLVDEWLEVAQMLRYAGKEAAWRTPYLRFVGNWLAAAQQYSSLRERFAAALLTSGDDAALVIFRRMAQSENSDIRKLGVLGLGWLRDFEAQDALVQALVLDEDETVQMCAAFALGALGTPQALTTLAENLELVSSNNTRRAITETLAMFPQTGYAFLYDAARHPELLVRRAIMWGLGRTQTDWAFILLNETFLSDSEWFVRSAAEQVLINAYQVDKQGVQLPPAIDTLEWLQAWAEVERERERLPKGTTDEALLVKAIEQNEQPLIRLLAVVVAGQLGVISAARALYRAMTDEQEAIRDAAFRALASLQARTGQPLPMP